MRRLPFCRPLSWPCALALLLGGCAATPRPAPPAPTAAPAVVSRGVDADLEGRALLLLMSDRRLFDAETLGVMLSRSAATREALAVALGRIGEPRGRSLLQGLLVDGDVAVRRAAAFALGELGDVAAAPALLRAAVDDDRECGALAVEALGKLGAPLADVRRVLGALVGDEGPQRLAPFLFRFREPAQVDVARELLLAGPLAVREGAAYALGREARPEGRSLLLSLLGDPGGFTRAWAARGLGEVGGVADLGALLPLVEAPEPGPRIQALRAAAKILSRGTALRPDGWPAALVAALAAEAPGVRAAALEAAGPFLPDPELEARLRAAWATGEPRQRELALAALVAGRVADGAELVRAAATSPDRRLRRAAAAAAAALAAVEALETLDPLGSLEALEALARDPEPSVRVAVIDALGGLPGSSPALDWLAPFLADADLTVRATALDRLAASPELPVERLEELVIASAADAAPDARLAGVRALAARGRSEPRETGAVIAALEPLARDRERLVRRAAAEALEALGAPRPEVGPVATGRDLAYYREVLAQTARRPLVELETERGSLRLRLDCPEAPLTCLSFLKLATQGYFDGLTWHRVVPDFVVQGGDPRGDGWGGPGYTLRDEINRLRYQRGAVGMALSGPDTGGSQFFVTLSPQPHLDGGYTVFGRVVAGEEVLDELRQGDRILRAREID